MANKQISDFTELTSAVATTDMLVQDSGSLLTQKMAVVREGFEDLKPTGDLMKGGTAPSLVQTIGAHLLHEYAGNGNDKASFIFHLPHDFVEGSDLFFHVHHAPTAATPTGTVIWRVYYQYAQGYSLGNFTGTDLTQDITATVTGSPQFDHLISEGTAINDATVGSVLRTDGIILATLERLGSTDTSAASEIFFGIDIHYQSDGRKTVNKNDTGTGYVKV